MVIELEVADLDLDDAVWARITQSAYGASPMDDPALVRAVSGAVKASSEVRR